MTLPDRHDILTGASEARVLPKALHAQQPDCEINAIWRSNQHRTPIFDQDRGGKPLWPDGHTFVVCLTHDADEVAHHHAIQASRKAWQSLWAFWQNRQKRFIGQGWDAARSIVTAIGPDEMQHFERWLELEKRFEARSTFFFTPEKVRRKHWSDCHYRYGDKICFDGQQCSVAEMIREIDRRGWEIGLHPSWWSYDDYDEMASQKEQIETALGKEVLSVRQHFLHYDIRVTPLIQERAGFMFDSTLGFNNDIGFRFGTSFPWMVWNLSEDKSSHILEIPLAIQDMAMLNPKKGLRWSPDHAFEEMRRMIEAVMSVGGVLTLLWHPNTMIWPTFWELYVEILEHLRGLNPWFASVREVGQWWRTQEMDLGPLEERNEKATGP